MMQNFNYLIGDPETRECAYVDPAWEVDRLLKIAEEEGYRVTKILLTHNHLDHIEGVEEVVSRTGAEIHIHLLDQESLKGGEGKIVLVAHGVGIPIGKIQVIPLHTPGHTPGSVCYQVQVHGDPFFHLFTGDTLFQGNCGRSDLPGGDSKSLFKSLFQLRRLDPTTRVYPGHDYGIKPVTTLSYENEHNPAMKARTFEEFNRLP